MTTRATCEVATTRDSAAVRLVHEGGSDKTVEVVQVDVKKKRLVIAWPTAGLMWFDFVTGLACGCPRGPWRLSDEDRARYCGELGIRPMTRVMKPLKRDRKKQDVHDPRQLWFQGTAK